MPNWKKVIVSGSNAILNNITASGNFSTLDGGVTVDAAANAELEVQGIISASGLLFASLSYDSTPNTDGVVVYDTDNGQFYYTGSYGGSGDTITGTDTHVLFFDGDDNPAGDSGLTYDKTTDALKVAGSIQHVGDPNTGIYFASDTIILKGNNANIVRFDTTEIEFFEDVVSDNKGEFLVDQNLNFAFGNGNARSGFRHDGSKAYTHVTVQPWQDKYALIGVPINVPGHGPLPGDYPHNYLVTGENYTVVTYSGNGGGGGDPDGPNPEPEDDGVGLFTIRGALSVIDHRSTSGSQDPMGGIKLSGNPSMLFFDTDASSSISGSFYNNSASAEFKFNSASLGLEFKTGDTNTDLLNVLHLSRSANEPLIGIGTSDPLKTLDIRATTSSAPANIILRTNEDGTIETNEETGRIIFAIESSSYLGTDFIRSGSTAAIFSRVLNSGSNGNTGTNGNLIFEVSDADNATKALEILTVGSGLDADEVSRGLFYGLVGSNKKIALLSGSLVMSDQSTTINMRAGTNSDTQTVRLGSVKDGVNDVLDSLEDNNTTGGLTLYKGGTSNIKLGGYGDYNFVSSSKNFGIGTKTPGEELEVVGDISASGTITAGGALFTGDLVVTGSQLITDDITSDGTIRARVKSFDIPHPTRKGKRLVYGALEGPEHGIYCRGESKELKVLLPPEWRAMVDKKGITVQITPIGDWQPLYFKKLQSNWLHFGCGDDREEVHFYWEVKGERTDVPKLETVQ